MKSKISFLLKVLIPVLGCLFLSSTAFAAYIDFTAQEWDDAIGGGTPIASNNVDGIDVTVQAQPDGADLTYNGQDGLGIDYYDPFYLDDEIDHSEKMIVTFSEEISLDEVILSDYYFDDDGWYMLGDTSGENFGDPIAMSLVTNGGNQSLEIGASAGSIMFGVDNTFLDHNNDYSVKGISFNSTTAVPELDLNAASSSLALLFGGVLVLTGRRRRQ